MHVSEVVHHVPQSEQIELHSRGLAKTKNKKKTTKGLIVRTIKSD